MFPGVRLNFSRSGVSTTIGRRGATVTLGHGSTYVNLGLPGTGLSYRTRVLPRPPQAGATRYWPQDGGAALAPRLEPAGGPALPRADADGVTKIESAATSVLASAGLDSLRALINEAAAHRAGLSKEIASSKRTVARARRRLGLAKTFIIRIVGYHSVPRLSLSLQTAQEKLKDLTEEFEASYVEVDFGLDQTAEASYQNLKGAFEGLQSCTCIWDVTGTKAVELGARAHGRFRGRQARARAL